MQVDSELINDFENFNLLNEMYMNIINTIKNSNGKREEIFPVYEAFHQEFMTPTTNNSVW
jgi:hypothetical protein